MVFNQQEQSLHQKNIQDEAENVHTHIFRKRVCAIDQMIILSFFSHFSGDFSLQ